MAESIASLLLPSPVFALPDAMPNVMSLPCVANNLTDNKRMFTPFPPLHGGAMAIRASIASLMVPQSPVTNVSPTLPSSTIRVPATVVSQIPVTIFPPSTISYHALVAASTTVPVLTPTTAMVAVPTTVPIPAPTAAYSVSHQFPVTPFPLQLFLTML